MPDKRGVFFLVDLAALAIGPLQSRQITRDMDLGLLDALGHLVDREVVVPAVHRFELAAIEGNDLLGKQIQLPAQADELRARLLNGAAVVLAEVGDSFVIGGQASCEPHQLDIAPRLTFESATRRNGVEIAIYVQLQKDRRMIARAPGRLGIDAREAELA